MTRRSRRIAVAIAVLPLVVLIGLRSAWAAYVCRVDRQIRSECCCGHKKSSHRPADDGPRMQASGCCDVMHGESALPPDARATEAHQIDSAPCVIASVPVAAPEPAVRTSRAEFEHAARPPPPDVPIYLVNRSILL